MAAPPPLPPRASGARWGVAGAATLIALAGIAAYASSFGGAFIQDDLAAISNNETIRHLGTSFFPPRDSPVAGRPLLNFSFGLSYALGGEDVRGYHALNLAIHLLAGLTLFGIARRTLSKPALAGVFGRDSLILALLVSLLWTVHPVQTEAVAYVSQRAESLVGLFYLLALYGFVRGEQAGRPARWYALSVGACLLGALTKEIIATAPLLVLLYDRTFCAGTFREAWRRRWRYYLGLAAAWPLLAWLSLGLGPRGVGFSYGIGSWDYALTSCRSVMRYLGLALWPHPLVLDYGAEIIRHPAAALPWALPLAALLAGTAVALRRWPAVGFAGAWFFLILAPTSSVVPVALQPMAEHRLYLPLAAVVGLEVLALYRLFGRRAFGLLAAAALVFGCLTFRRNQDYGSAQAIWADTAAKAPGNPRAHNGYGFVLASLPGGLDRAIAEYRAALRIDPAYAEAHNNLGIALGRVPGRAPEAEAEFRAALRINPDFAIAHNNLGALLATVPGRLPEAISEYEAALRTSPDYAEAHNNLGIALAGSASTLPEAVSHFEAALRAHPDYLEARENLAMALVGLPGRLPQAVAEYEAVLRLRPADAEVRNNLGIALANSPGRLDEGIAQFREAVRLRPDYADARRNLDLALRKAAQDR